MHSCDNSGLSESMYQELVDAGGIDYGESRGAASEKAKKPNHSKEVESTCAVM